ncbi:7186_t:CDS:1, partial [Funneliformis caledonium]
NLEGIPSHFNFAYIMGVALLQQKHHHVIEETIAKYSGDYDIYLVCSN